MQDPTPRETEAQVYRVDPHDGVRSVGEPSVEYQLSLSFRLGPELSYRLRLAAFARRWAPEVLAAKLLTRGLDQEPDRVRAEMAMKILTPRERDVTRLTGLGQTNHQIAYELGISGETVKSHIRSTLAKLGLHSKSELRLHVHTLDPEHVHTLDPGHVHTLDPGHLQALGPWEDGSDLER